MNQRQLAWAYQNRRPAREDRRVGELAGQVLEGVRSSTAGHLAHLQQVIGAGTDREFREHCTLGSLRGNALTILVDQESLVSAVRLKWLYPLRDLISKQCGGFHVEDIRFKWGRSELTLVCQEDSAVGR